jgi:hypothetical protein
MFCCISASNNNANSTNQQHQVTRQGRQQASQNEQARQRPLNEEPNCWLPVVAATGGEKEIVADAQSDWVGF